MNLQLNAGSPPARCFVLPDDKLALLHLLLNNLLAGPLEPSIAVLESARFPAVLMSVGLIELDTCNCSPSGACDCVGSDTQAIAFRTKQYLFVLQNRKHSNKGLNLRKV